MTYKIKTIMVVEDDRTILETVSHFLEIEGFVVFPAGNGFEALEILEGIESPDLILLDMKMPLMDGWEFAKIYHERYDHKAPFFVMTAAADARKRAIDVGAIDWLEKPFDFSDLLFKISALENQNKRNETQNLLNNPGS